MKTLYNHRGNKGKKNTMKITSLSKVLFGVIRKGEPTAKEVAELANKFCKSNGRYREVLSAEMLPKDVKKTLNMLGISNPSLMTGYNSRSGSVVAGVRVLDGRRTVGHIAVGLDKTKGSAPILQFRGKVFDKSKNEMAKLQFLMNPNSPIDEATDVATFMAKRKGNITVHSEIGDSHYYDLMVNPERMESVLGTTIPASKYGEKQLRSMYQEIQSADYPSDIKRAGEKFAGLFSAEARKKSVAQAASVKPLKKAEVPIAAQKTVKAEAFAKKDIAKRAVDDVIPKHEAKAPVSKEIAANNGTGKKIAKTISQSKVYKVVSKSISEKYALGPEVRKVSHSEEPIHYGKHKVKRYLYHMTSEENYKKMLEDGRIRTSEDFHLDSEGIFMTELENLAKRWRTAKEWNEIMPENKDGVYLSLGLLKQVSKDSKNIVCLRIPTKYMNHNALKIRSQNKLVNPEKEAFRSHITYGAPAKDANLYKQRKEAIEYIYEHDIPMNQVELVGKAEVPQISEESFLTWSAGKQKDVVKNFFLNLFKDQPEVKGIETMM